jgi:transcriptional regulator with XRE-family HTH domain
MRSHLSILAGLLRSRGVKQEDVAKALGYNSQSMVSMMLRGERPVGRVELERMCEMAGITIVGLAAMSDDLVLAKRPEAVEGAAILDEIPPAELAAAMALLRAYRSKGSDR